MVVSEKTKDKDLISVIIPTLNEEKLLRVTLRLLFERSAANNIEVIVVDGGSTDKTLEVASLFPVQILKMENCGRAIQMNAGAKKAKGNALFFLHADAQVPLKFDQYIVSTLKENDFGFFAYRFNSRKTLLKLMASFNASKGPFAGGGDQGLFISSDTFWSVGGFDNQQVIMEDFDLKNRLVKQGYVYKIVSDVKMVLSARKYESNSFLKVWVANTLAYLMFSVGVSSKAIQKFYSGWLESRGFKN